MKPLALVVAMSSNGVIGKDGGLPWHIPEDLKHFRQVTTGHAIIMGRRTWDEIGRPLPNRRNIVITRQTDFEVSGAEVVHTLEDAIALARDGGDSEPRIVGGATIYAQALPLITRFYLTVVQREIEGDTHFPPWDPDQWREEARRDGDGLLFQTLVRR
jgi:dihydrofolate reductase